MGMRRNILKFVSMGIAISSSQPAKAFMKSKSHAMSAILLRMLSVTCSSFVGMAVALCRLDRMTSNNLIDSISEPHYPLPGKFSLLPKARVYSSISL